MNRASFTTDGQLNVGKYNVRIPDDAFYIQNSGHILENSLTATTHHSAVELRWSCTEEPVDFFTVQRRRKDRSNWDTVATDVQGLTYTDETVSPSYDYVYRVASVVDCEGRDSVYTREVEGSCEHFGRLEGYLRFADGTGIPNVTLFVDSEDGEKVSRQVSTDEKGYFMVDNLPYGGQETRSYRVTCSLPKSDLSADCGDGIPVVFDGEPKGNLKTNVNFTVTTGVKMSGYVMYKGTSIPVVGASFLIDGQPVSTAAGPVKTNYEGKYEFYMVKGEHSIQATMKGHVFYQNGYYHADERDPESKTKYDFQTNKAGVYFYDDTRVKLIGRVVGGTTQGDLPLGNSLSTNNLGDNVKMVLTLEGDKTSMLVFENTDRSLTERNEEFIHKKHGRLDTKERMTRVHTSRYRMEVLPDTLTGEYEVLLPPVKWKIQQISADGYATLFQDGTTDETGKTYHLIRDEVISYGPQVTSTFVHSQQHILKQIMPALDRQCDALMFTGTEAEAVAQANATGKPVYLSLVAATDSLRFGVTNLNKQTEYVYYTLQKGVKSHQPVQGDLLNYLIVLPDNYDDAAHEDLVRDFGQALAAWARMIAQNEEDKLAANELVKNFDIDGGANVSYGESFESSYSLSQSYSWIGSDFSHNYFAYDDPFDSSSAATSAGNTFAVVGITVGKILAKIAGGLGLGPSFGKVESTASDGRNSDGDLLVNVNFSGTKWTFTLSPVASYSTVPSSATKKAYSRKESFSIAMAKESHLNFDVYRVKLRDKTNEKVSATDVFYNENYLTYQDYVKYFLDRKVGSVSITADYAAAKGFVYRTRGGATARPWEGERKSLFYNPGTVMDERTKRIENPVIKMDKQSVSGVPYGQPARFKLYLTNDSEAPEAIGLSMSYFTLYQDNMKNPAGAKLTVDGLPLTQDGTTVHILPGEVTEKVLEAYR